MDFVATKAMVIGVGIFITLAITTTILFIFNQISSIYQKVYQTEVGIKEEFNEYTMYQNAKFTGLELYNTVRKFRDNNNVRISVNNVEINKNTYISNYDEKLGQYSSNIYNVDYEEEGNEKIVIYFK